MGTLTFFGGHPLLGASQVAVLPVQETWKTRFDPWVRKIPWRRKWQPTPGFLPGESHGWRSLEGYSTWGRKRVGHDWALSTSWLIVSNALFGINRWYYSSGKMMQNDVMQNYGMEWRWSTSSPGTAPNFKARSPASRKLLSPTQSGVFATPDGSKGNLEGLGRAVRPCSQFQWPLSAQWPWVTL